MQKFRDVLNALGLILGTTIGAGIFALPYVFHRSGWALSLFYLAGLTLSLVFAHNIFLKTITITGRRGNLVQLVGSYFGKTGTTFAFIAVVGGLLLTLVAYLVLGAKFLSVVFPDAPQAYLLIFFWLISSAPLLWEKEFFLKAEFWGSVGMGIIILLVFFSKGEGAVEYSGPEENLLFPLGTILFSLAGWTAVEPLGKLLKKTKAKLPIIFGGTILVSILYILFISGIFSSATEITSDTISGLGNWSSVQIFLLSLLGLFAVWTSYMPSAVEIKNSLIHLGLKKPEVVAIVFFAPLFMVVLGMKSFIALVSLAGGVFLALQYFFIMAVGQRVLKLKGPAKFFSQLLIIVFLLAAILEAYYFIVN